MRQPPLSQKSLEIPMAVKMFPSIDIILSFLGFVTFLVIAVLIVVVVQVDVDDLAEPFLESLDTPESNIIIAIVLAVLIALIFLIIFLILLSMVINCKCGCWRTLQTKCFTELILLFGKPQGDQADEEAPEEQPEEEPKEEMSAVQGQAPKERMSAMEGPAEGSQATVDFNPIVVSTLPSWIKGPMEAEYLGLAFNEEERWSYQGSLPTSLVESSRARRH